MTSTRSRPQQPAASNRGFVWIIVAIAIVGALVVAFLATNRGSDVTVAAEQTGSVNLVGEALPPLPDGVSIGTAANDPVIGSLAPTLTASDFEGNEVTVGPDGRPKAIYFLAHWCPHCQAEVPAVQQLITQGSLPEGVNLYAVSTAVDEGRGNYPPQEWLADEGFEPLTVRDDASSSAFAGFGGTGFPYVVYLDGDNQLVGRSSGSLEPEAIEQLWTQLAATTS